MNRGRLIAFCVFAAFFVMSGVYILNPLRAVSHDPRLRFWGVTIFHVPSRAMEPTIPLNRIIFVSLWPYRFDVPKPGDLVVFQYPQDRSINYVKRIIAVAAIHDR
jgi:signal peptidase I